MPAGRASGRRLIAGQRSSGRLPEQGRCIRWVWPHVPRSPAERFQNHCSPPWPYRCRSRQHRKQWQGEYENRPVEATPVCTLSPNCDKWVCTMCAVCGHSRPNSGRLWMVRRCPTSWSRIEAAAWRNQEGSGMAVIIGNLLPCSCAECPIPWCKRTSGFTDVGYVQKRHGALGPGNRSVQWMPAAFPASVSDPVE